MRYYKSSYNDGDTVAIATNLTVLLQGGVTTGRSFWLKGIAITNAHAATGGIMQIYDSNTEAAVGTDPPYVTDERLQVYVGPITTVVVDIPHPGIKFDTGVAAGHTALVAGLGTAYGVSITGYEE